MITVTFIFPLLQTGKSNLMVLENLNIFCHRAMLVNLSSEKRGMKNFISILRAKAHMDTLVLQHLRAAGHVGWGLMVEMASSAEHPAHHPQSSATGHTHCTLFPVTERALAQSSSLKETCV